VKEINTSQPMIYPFKLYDKPPTKESKHPKATDDNSQSATCALEDELLEHEDVDEMKSVDKDEVNQDKSEGGKGKVSYAEQEGIKKNEKQEMSEQVAKLDENVGRDEDTIEQVGDQAAKVKYHSLGIPMVEEDLNMVVDNITDNSIQNNCGDSNSSMNIDIMSRSTLPTSPNTIEVLQAINWNDNNTSTCGSMELVDVDVDSWYQPSYTPVNSEADISYMEVNYQAIDNNSNESSPFKKQKI